MLYSWICSCRIFGAEDRRDGCGGPRKRAEGQGSRNTNTTVKLVKKYIKRNIWENFTDYSEINAHQKSKRNKSLLLKVPKVRLQITKQGFYFQVVQLLANKNQINWSLQKLCQRINWIWILMPGCSLTLLFFTGDYAELNFMLFLFVLVVN